MNGVVVRAIVALVAVGATVVLAMGTLVLGPLRAAAAQGAPTAAVLPAVERGLLLTGVSAALAAAGWALWSGLVGARGVRCARTAIGRLVRGDLATPLDGASQALLPEIVALRDELSRCSREQAEALGTVAHDLRGPLAGVALAAERLARAADETARLQALEAARRECARAAAIADDVLDRCRGVARGERLAPVGSVLADIARRVGSEVVELDVEPAAASVLCADADAARTVANLAENAVRHATSAPVRIRARRTAGRIEVTVEDDGPGFEPDRAAVFASGAGGGAAGLGLASARRCAERLGGDIRFERRAEGGMRAVVRLPGAVER